MLFKLKTIDEAYVHAQYMESYNKKGKGKKNKTTATAHVCKDPGNHCYHYNIEGYTKAKCYILHI